MCDLEWVRVFWLVLLPPSFEFSMPSLAFVSLLMEVDESFLVGKRLSLLNRDVFLFMS